MYKGCCQAQWPVTETDFVLSRSQLSVRRDRMGSMQDPEKAGSLSYGFGSPRRSPGPGVGCLLLSCWGKDEREQIYFLPSPNK